MLDGMVVERKTAVAFAPLSLIGILFLSCFCPKGEGEAERPLGMEGKGALAKRPFPITPHPTQPHPTNPLRRLRLPCRQRGASRPPNREIRCELAATRQGAPSLRHLLNSTTKN